MNRPIPNPSDETREPTDRPARRDWTLPQVVELPKLTQLTLQTGGGSTVIP